MDNKRMVFFTGAGVSKESGIATFRDKDGLWTRYDPTELASIQGLRRNPELSMQFLNGLKQAVAESSPNHAHQLIAALEASYDIVVVTQNVDDLHERAGSSTVYHLHGEAGKVTSSRNPSDPSCIEPYPLDKPIRIGDKARDGSQLRPAITLFGESLPERDVEMSIRAISMAEILVVIGTSLTVQPAASFIDYAPAHCAKYLIDPGEFASWQIMGFTHIQLPATSGMDKLHEMLDSQ